MLDQNTCYTKYFEIEYFKKKNYKNTFTITVTTIVLGHQRLTTMPCYASHRAKERMFQSILVTSSLHLSGGGGGEWD